MAIERSTSGTFSGKARPQNASRLTAAGLHLEPANGRRAEFLDIFESKSVPEHQKIGMKILGPFLSVEDDDTFFFMRAFPDLKSREPMKDQFYKGKLWKQELEQKLMPMIEKYEVVVVEAKDGLGSWR